MELKTNLIKAVLGVMSEVGKIKKTLTVGTGNSSYKAVADEEVKDKIGELMVKFGLIILPIEINESEKINTFETKDRYGNDVLKQSVFTSVKTKYLLMHESGESQIITGYGQGTDPQDKSAGKATTYALKYALLYTFMVPTTKIEDTDKTHSLALPVFHKKLSLKEIEELKNEAVKCLLDAKTENDLTKIYHSFPGLKKDKDWINALAETKKTILNK